MAKVKYYSLWLALIAIIFFLIQITYPAFTDVLVLNSDAWTQPWRFVSSIFLHANAGHLLYNLFALILFGLITEKVISSKKFLLVFFTTGIIANLVAVNFYNSSLGASGAIFGVIGALTILKPKLPVFLFGFPLPLALASIVWIIGDVIQTIYPSNIGTIAHLSGLAIGFVFGIYYRKKLSKNKNQINYKIKIPENHMQFWEDVYMKDDR